MPLAVDVSLAAGVLTVAFDDAVDESVSVSVSPTGFTTAGAVEASGTGTIRRLVVSDAGTSRRSAVTLARMDQTLLDGLQVAASVDSAVIEDAILTEGGGVVIDAARIVLAGGRIDSGGGPQAYGGAVSLSGGSSVGMSVQNLTVVGDRMFFAVGDGPRAGLWKTDGTSAGTQLVKAGIGSARNLVNVGGVLVFTASTPATGEELWRSDGTEAGTYLLRELKPGSGSVFPLTFRGSGYEVAQSDHTFEKIVFQNQLFFGVVGSYWTEPPYDDNGNFWRLWKTDGTEAGTVPVTTVATGNSFGGPSGLAVLGSQLVFASYTPQQGSELWISDGTSAGTRLVRDIRPGSGSSSPLGFRPLGGSTLLFTADDGTGREVWRTDGTWAGTARVKDVHPTGGSDPSWLATAADGIYFTASDGESGRELWKTDGTESGTLRMADINPGDASSNPAAMLAAGANHFFSATDGSGGYELWKTDGSPGGTSLVKDIRPGAQPTSPGDGPLPLVSIGNTVFLAASDGVSGFELWKSDGSAAGTALVKDARVGAADAFTDTDPIVVTTVGNTVYFRVTVVESLAGDSYELWKTDGTPAGTSRVLADRVNHFTFFQGTLYFGAGIGNPRLCRLDPVTGAVEVVADMVAVRLIGSDVALRGGVSGAVHALTITGAAEIRGPIVGLESITVSGDVRLGGSIVTSGDQSYAQGVQLVADASLSARNLHFGGAVDGGQKRLALHSATRTGTPPEAFTNVADLTAWPPVVRAPRPPTDLQATSGDRQAALVWAAPADDGGSPITDYVVERSGDGGITWTVFQEGVSTTPSATVTGLTNGTAYVFRVSAVNASATGEASAVSAPATPRTLPGPPQALVVGTVAGPGPGGFRAQWLFPADSGGAEVTDFIVEYSVDDGITWTTVDDSVSVSREIIVTGLQRGTEHLVRVSAVNAAGRGSPSSSLRVTPPATPPAAPSGVLANASAGAAVVSWAPPADDGLPLTDYVVEYSADGGGTWMTFADGPGTQPAATVTGLANGTGYVFRVAAVNVAGPGPASDPSAVVTPRAVPEAPTGVVGTSGNGSVRLEWLAPAVSGGAAITDYVVEFRPAAAATWTTFADASSPDTTATVTGLLNGTGYVFRVSAVNVVGTGTVSAASVSVTPAPTRPAPPTDVVAIPGNASARVSWAAPVLTGGSPLTDYVVQYRSSASQTWTTLSDGVSTVTSATVTGLANGTAYLFQVAAVNGVGAGQPSSESVAVVPRTIPGVPTGVVGSPDGSSVRLRWTAPAVTGGAAISDYVVQFKAAAAPVWRTFADGVSPSPNAIVTGLANGTPYVFRVLAVNGAGQGRLSVASAAVTPRAAPASPRALKATAGNGRVALSWLAPASTGGAVITDYLVEYSGDGGSSWLRVADGVSPRRTAVVTGLTNGRAYLFRVAAVNVAGAGVIATVPSPVVPRA